MKTTIQHIRKMSTGALSLLLMGTLPLASCSDNDIIPNVTPAYCPSSITMDIPSDYARLIYTDNTGASVLPLIKGQAVQLGYTLTPDTVTFNDVKWTSSDATVATVTDGQVEALSEKGLGYSIITVAPTGMYSGSGVLSTLKVKVSDHLQPASAITLTFTSDEVYVGEQLALAYDIEPEAATYRTLEWTSSDPSIATVDSKGVVSGVGTGSSAIRATVTITATALDGSGVTASKTITVKRVVQPEDIILDQTYAASNYDCAVADRQLTIGYTTYPLESTTSLIQWSSSNENIATVENGVVTFNQNGNFGEFTITATCPSTGKQSSIKLNLAGGLIREQFNDASHYTWWNASQSGNGTSSSHVIHPDEAGGYVTVTTYTQNATKQRGDFKCWENKSWLVPSAYPLLAVRLQDVNDIYGYSRNINLDTSGSDMATGVKYAGNVGGSNNKWKTKYKLSDGSCVLIYDLSTQSFATGGLLPAGSVAQFTSLQFKYADIGTVDHQITYNVYWVQTFKSDADIRALIAKEGLTIN